MDFFDIIRVIARWIHIFSAVIALGGSIFSRFVLAPAAEQLGESAHTELRTRIMDRWRGILHLCIGGFLLSGFYNYLAVQIPNHKGDGPYHALMGIKILVAFAVFYFMIALTGRTKSTQFVRNNLPKWTLITISLACLIILISGYLNIRGVPVKTLP